MIADHQNVECTDSAHTEVEDLSSRSVRLKLLYKKYFLKVILEAEILFPPQVLIRWRKEGNVLFNDALNTFYLRLIGVRHMVEDHLYSERGNPLPPHGILHPISSKGYFICTIPQTG